MRLCPAALCKALCWGLQHLTCVVHREREPPPPPPDKNKDAKKKK